MSSKSILIVASCVALAACNTVHKRIGQDDPFLGEAVRYNAAVQTINPDPVYSQDDAQPGDNGEKGAKAVQRYRTDQINARHQAQAKQGSILGSSAGTGDSGSSGGGPR